MPYDSDFFDKLRDDLTRFGIPAVAWVNDSDSDEPITPRDEVGIPYEQCTPQMVHALIGYLLSKGVPNKDIHITVVVEFGLGQG